MLTVGRVHGSLGRPVEAVGRVGSQGLGAVGELRCPEMNLWLAAPELHESGGRGTKSAAAEATAAAAAEEAVEEAAGGGARRSSEVTWGADGGVA